MRSCLWFRLLAVLPLLLVLHVSDLQAQFNDTIVYLEWAPGEDPLRSIVINWITDSGGGTPAVEYRAGSSGDFTAVTGTSSAIPDIAKQRNRVLIDALSPGTAYEFRITSGDITNAVHRFRTPPSSIESPFRFIVGGDTYTGDGGELDDLYEEVAAQAALQNPWFAVIGGDLAAADADPDNLYKWFGLLGGWYRQMVTPDGYMIPFVAVIGNHEVPDDFDAEPEEARYIRAFFDFPGDQGYGVHDFDNYLSIVALNTGHTAPVPGAQTTWLDGVLGSREGVDHLFPVYHKASWPGYELVGARHDEILENWGPLFEEHGLRYVFEHDNAIYARTYPLLRNPAYNGNIFNRGTIDEWGIHYMGNGGWGVKILDPPRETGPDKSWWYLEDTQSASHFYLVEITDSYRVATALDKNGDELGSVTDYIALDSPALLAASHIEETSFRINWNPVEGARNYRLDVSTDPDFSTFVSFYESWNVGDRTNYSVQVPETNTTYYYRLRAQLKRSTRLGDVISENSETQSVKLVRVDPALSEMVATPVEVQADGDEIAEIRVTLRNEFDETLDGVEVSLSQGAGSSQIEAVQGTTDVDGVAIFNVSSMRAEQVTYQAQAVNTTIDQTVTISFTPAPPESLEASELLATGFRANWEAVDGATTYYLDVSTDENFSTFLPDLENRDTEGSTSHVVNGLEPGTVYYYRVRAEAPTGTSAHSETVSARTLEADADLTVLTANPGTVPADGEQESTIVVRVRNENGTDLDGVNVTLTQVNGISDITTIQGTTDLNGEAFFSVTNARAEQVTYLAVAGAVEVNNTVNVDFTPLPPVATDADRIGAVLFTANWEEVAGAGGYRLDISKEPDFSSIDPGFEDMDAGSGTAFEVTGLEGDVTYYYRVRAVASTGVSGNSNTIQLSTRSINATASTAGSSRRKVLANGVQETIVSVHVVNDENNSLEGVPVKLETDDEKSHVRVVEEVTGENGEALFAVSSESTGMIAYRILAGGVELGEAIVIEYLSVEERAKIGDNYPNPFPGRTIIPLIVPEAMNIKIVVANIAGAVVMTLKDEVMNAGYFEISFNGSGLASGPYFYMLITSDGAETKKMMLIK